MNQEQRDEAVFGLYDGTVSTIGFVFGLLVHGSPVAAIAVGGLGGAISATVSMSTGAFESSEGTLRARLGNGFAMGVATLIGSLIPVWPYFVLSRHWAVAAGAIGCVVAAGWIGAQKRRVLEKSRVEHSTLKAYLSAYVTLLGAAGLTLAVIAAIPSSVG